MNIHALITLTLVLVSTVLQILWLDNTHWVFLSIAAMMAGVWLISLPLKNVAIIDIFWGLSFIVGTLAALWVFADFSNQPNLILLAMVSLWGLRLGLYILARSIGKPEDARYAAMRAEGGDLFWIRSLFMIFLLQAWMSWGILAPITAQIQSNVANTLTPVAWLGIVLWLFGLLYESIGDDQMRRFKKDPENKGKLLTTGLWRYSRHPNYFGEAVLWWGLYLFTVPYGGAWFVIGPLIITYSLLKFSGVTMLEDGLKKSKPGFEDYTRMTPAFVPSWLWPFGR